MMMDIDDNANKSTTNAGGHALCSADARRTRQHVPEGIAVHSSNSSCRHQVMLLSQVMT